MLDPFPTETGHVGHAAITGNAPQLAVIPAGDETLIRRIGRETQNGTVMNGHRVPLTGSAHRGDVHGAIPEAKPDTPSVTGKPGGDDERVKVAGGAAGLQQEGGFGGLAHGSATGSEYSCTSYRSLRRWSWATPDGCRSSGHQVEGSPACQGT
jgi:hypothetical protein